MLHCHSAQRRDSVQEVMTSWQWQQLSAAFLPCRCEHVPLNASFLTPASILLHRLVHAWISELLATGILNRPLTFDFQV